MALSNKERVGRVLDTLTEGLAPFVVREYRMVYKGDYAREVDAALATNAFELPREALADADTLLSHLDAQNTLNLMLRRWSEVFQEKLGHPGRNYVGEMMSGPRRLGAPEGLHQRRGLPRGRHRLAAAQDGQRRRAGRHRRRDRAGPAAAAL